MSTSRPDDVSRLDPTKRVGDEQKQSPTPSESFGSYMEKANQPSSKSVGVSPFELAKGSQPLAVGPTFDNLLAQVKASQSMLGDMNTQLQTPNLKLKQSQRYLLRNKLSDANSYLRAANSKMGSQTPEESNQPSKGGVIGKFLDYISEGQSNLSTAQKQLMSLKAKGDSLNPADFLSIQLKLAHAQQEIEYASIMLSKAVDDMKTLFNIQL